MATESYKENSDETSHSIDFAKGFVLYSDS